MSLSTIKKKKHTLLFQTQTPNSKYRFSAPRTCQQHVEFPHARVQVDGGAEEVEGGGILLHGQVHQAQVVQHLPVKGRQVVGPLQTADGLRETEANGRQDCERKVPQ